MIRKEARFCETIICYICGHFSLCMQWITFLLLTSTISCFSFYNAGSNNENIYVDLRPATGSTISRCQILLSHFQRILSFVRRLKEKIIIKPHYKTLLLVVWQVIKNPRLSLTNTLDHFPKPRDILVQLENIHSLINNRETAYGGIWLYTPISCCAQETMHHDKEDSWARNFFKIWFPLAFFFLVKSQQALSTAS